MKDLDHRQHDDLFHRAMSQKAGYLVRDYAFLPLSYAAPDHIEDLSALLASQQVPARFSLSVLRRRRSWATTLPLGAFINDFRPDVATQADQLAHFRAVCATAAAGQRVRQRLYKRGAEPQERDGRVFWHTDALYAVCDALEQPAFIRAVLRFFEAVKRDPSLVVPKRAQAPYIPPAQRKEYFNLKTRESCRGPSWTSDEDAVLYRWFGIRTVGPNAGRHARLTENEWLKVVAALDNRRSRASIQSRIVVLNKKLLKEYLVNGYISITDQQEYLRRALGEKPRLPPARFCRKNRRDKAL